MALTFAFRRRPVDPAEAARVHFILRFAVGTTLGYTICEVMGWQPSALAAVLSGILLANVPTAMPLKAGLALVVVMYLSAWLTFALTMWLHEVPHILFGVIGLILFLAFAVLAQAKAQLPLTLLLICIAIIPVLTLTDPDFGARLREVLVRATIMAIIMNWSMHAIWPRVVVIPKAPPQQAVDAPVATAAIGTLIVLPVMLVYWLFGLIDAMPVLLQTILLVAKMEQERSAETALTKLIANFLGGFAGLAAYLLLGAVPSIEVFFLIVFIMSVYFGAKISQGGRAGSNAELAFNAAMIIFGLFILKGDSNSGAWLARMVQFFIGCAFAVGMMALLWPRIKAAQSKSAATGDFVNI